MPEYGTIAHVTARTNQGFHTWQLAPASIFARGTPLGLFGNLFYVFQQSTLQVIMLQPGGRNYPVKCSVITS